MGLVNVNTDNINLNTDIYSQNFGGFTPTLGGNYYTTDSTFMILANLLNGSMNLKTEPNFSKNNYKPNSSNLKLQNVGYSAAKGQRLADIAKQNATGFKGLCATYVKKDIEKAGLGKYEYGHAFQCAEILRRNPNFKEISTKGLDLSSLPAGCVLVYGKKVAKYNPEYGHIEITDGKGNAYSDGKTGRIRPGAKVFVPVSTNYMA